MQRDEYLPLKVIKERLARTDAGEDADGLEIDAAVDGDGAGVAEELAEAPTGLQMSLEEMSAATGVDRDRIKELESFGIVCTHGPEGARYYDGEDYIVLSIVKDFLRHGIEPRHLTMYKHFADRESSFFEALVAPTLRQRNPDARRTATQTLTELSVTSRKFKQALLRNALRDHLTSA
jgi:DNA-binding transcriptional MerR regulator